METVSESIPPVSQSNPQPTTPAVNPIFGVKVHRWNPQTARAARAKQAEIHKRNAAISSGLLEITPRQPTVQPTDAYVQSRLTRIRAHIETTDEALAKAKEPIDRERLARALAALQDQERILAGRPLPGSHRPVAVRGRGGSSFAEPV